MRGRPRHVLLALLATACGGSDSSELFAPSGSGAPSVGSSESVGLDAGGASGGSKSGGAGAGGNGGQATPPSGGAPGSAGVGASAGLGGNSGGSAGVAAGGAMPVAGGGGTTAVGGAGTGLPTGTTGFPTNPPVCPPELPPNGQACTFGTACQYPGVLCVCGPTSTFQCSPQENQCLDQAHCTSGGVCHPDLHVCTECVDDSLCLDPTRPKCRGDGVCVTCVSNLECGGVTPVCNIIPISPAVNTCVQCLQDTDCPGDGETCEPVFGVCQPG